jgi:hypothetical protein
LQINTTATGYFPYNATITPISETTALLNISMNKTSPAVTGLGIGGIVREGIFSSGVITGGYGNPISGATIRVVNTTTSESYLTASNTFGWYLCDNGASCNLVFNRSYSVNASKLRYLGSPFYNVTALGSPI